MPDKHLKYGGSTAGRTLACAAWPNLPHAPEGKDMSAADHGTLCHNYMEALELGKPLPTSYNDEVLTTDDVTNLIAPAHGALDDIYDKHNPCEVRVEPFVELIEGLAGGSIDWLGLSEDRKTLIIADYKFGRTPVDVDTTAQLPFYALCVLVDPCFAGLIADVESISLNIIQPQCEGHTERTMTLEELYAFEDRIYTAIDAAENWDVDTGEVNPGPHCAWCPAHATCKQHRASAADALRLDAANIDTLGEALTLVQQLKPWIRKVEKLAHEQAQLSNLPDGFKLVEKRPRRQWTDEAAALAMLKAARYRLSDVTDTKILSPAQMEKFIAENPKKALDADMLMEYSQPISNGTTVVPESDKREPVVSAEQLGNALKALQ